MRYQQFLLSLVDIAGRPLQIINIRVSRGQVQRKIINLVSLVVRVYSYLQNEMISTISRSLVAFVGRHNEF